MFRFRFFGPKKGRKRRKLGPVLAGRRSLDQLLPFRFITLFGLLLQTDVAILLIGTDGPTVKCLFPPFPPIEKTRRTGVVAARSREQSKEPPCVSVYSHQLVALVAETEKEREREREPGPGFQSLFYFRLMMGSSSRSMNRCLVSIEDERRVFG